MIRGKTTLAAPRDRRELVATVADADGRAVIIGGGTAILPDLARAPGETRCLVDLGHAGLETVDTAEGRLSLGATVSYAQAFETPQILHAAPLLASASRGITGGRSIRAQGTIGGSACYANPSSDMPACLVALGATMTLDSAAGPREVAARDFFVGPYTTARRVGEEVLVAIGIPARTPGRDAWGYYKFKLAESSWPVATASCVLDLGEDGQTAAATIVLGGVAGTPIVIDVTAALEHAEPTAAIAAAATAAVVEPWGDVLASAAYRRDIAGAVAVRAYRAARDNQEVERGGR